MRIVPPSGTTTGATLTLLINLATAAQAEIAWGVNLAGAEYGSTQTDVFATQYIYPNSPGTVNSFSYYQRKNLRLIRLPILWEHIQKNLWSALDANEVQRLRSCVSDANTYGLKVIVDVHNYARYQKDGWKQVVGRDFDKSALGDLWVRLANELKTYPNIWAYDLMNEPWGMGASNDADSGRQVWFDVAQATIHAIRTVDGSTRIAISGYQSSHANNWSYYSDTLKNLTDPSNNLIYQAHEYFDADTSGTYNGNSNFDFQSQTGGNTDLGVQRVQPFITWLRNNGKKGFLGECSIPGNNQWGWNELFRKVVQLCKDNNDVVLGLNYWAGGPWWPVNAQDSTIQPLDDDNNPQNPAIWTDRPQMGIYLGVTGGQATYGTLPATSNDQITALSAPASVIRGSSATMTITYSNVANSDRRLAGMFFSVTGKGGTNEVWTYQNGDFPAVSGSSSRNVVLTIPAGCPTGDAAWLAQVQNASGATTFSAKSQYGTVIAGDNARYHFETDVQGWGNGWNASQITGVAVSTDTAYAGSRSLKTTLSNTSGSVQYPAVLVANPAGLAAGTVVTFRYYIPSSTNITGLQTFVQTSNVSWTANWTSNPTKGSWIQASVTVPANPGSVFGLGLQVQVPNGASGAFYLDSVTW